MADGFMTAEEQFRITLREFDPVLMELSGMGHAAVAIILRFKSENPEVLLIQRSENENDPWSGHLALPGGRVDPEDDSAQQTAEREALEETGIKLHRSDCLGRLSDVSATGIPVVVSCFVYICNREFEFNLDEREVADAFWVPLSVINDPIRAVTIEENYPGGKKTFPAVKVPGKSQPLWGMTFSLLKAFIQSTNLV